MMNSIARRNVTAVSVYCFLLLFPSHFLYCADEIDWLPSMGLIVDFTKSADQRIGGIIPIKNENTAPAVWSVSFDLSTTNALQLRPGQTSGWVKTYAFAPRQHGTALYEMNMFAKIDYAPSVPLDDEVFVRIKGPEPDWTPWIAMRVIEEDYFETHGPSRGIDEPMKSAWRRKSANSMSQWWMAELDYNPCGHHDFYSRETSGITNRVYPVDERSGELVNDKETRCVQLQWRGDGLPPEFRLLQITVQGMIAHEPIKPSGPPYAYDPTNGTMSAPHCVFHVRQ